MWLRIVVKFFAGHREIVGRRDEVYQLPEGSMLGDLIDLVVDRYPSLRDLMGDAAYGINQVVSESNRELKEGDEVAILPPVSGG